MSGVCNITAPLGFPSCKINGLPASSSISNRRAQIPSNATQWRKMVWKLLAVIREAVNSCEE
ncbi:Uncharacterised protein [Vibrio cholerae]|nr:Uncharacterised protein [Vibrio cholerae]CSI58441.1 Uncharacterised protein [Vibrio cholerae]